MDLYPAVGPDSFGVQQYSYVFPDTKKLVLFQYTVCYLELRQGKLHNLTLSTLSLVPMVAYGKGRQFNCWGLQPGSSPFPEVREGEVSRGEGGRTSAPEVQEVPRRCVGFTKCAQSLGVGVLCSLQRSLKRLLLYFLHLFWSVCVCTVTCRSALMLLTKKLKTSWESGK